MKRLMFVALMLLACAGCSAVLEVERLHVGLGALHSVPAQRKEDQFLIAERLLCAGVAPEQVQAVLRGNGLDATEAEKVTTLALALAACPLAKR